MTGDLLGGPRVKQLLLLLALGYSFAASATITITAVTGASKTGTLGISGQGAIIYGGIAGSTANSGTAVQDSCQASMLTCTTAPFCACNKQQIGDNVQVVISFISDQPITDTTGIQKLVSIGNNQGQVVTTASSQAYTGPGATQQITTTWGQLCTAAGSLSSITSCSSMPTSGLTMYVGLSNGQTFSDYALITVTVLGASGTLPDTLTNDDCSGSVGAFCRFTALPGDAVAYIDDVRGDAGFPGNTTGIRVYASENNFANASPTNAIATQDFSLGSDGTLSGAIFSGLQNDGPVYTFRVAAIDIAGNVHSFTSDNNITSASFGNCNIAAGAETSNSACLYKAQPDPVLGILTKDMNCFIATAAYGSSLEPKLTTFRQFRNHFLAVNKLGRRFIYSYYHWGPYAARWIGDREWARAAVRVGLWPVWLFSYTSLELGLTKAIALTLMTIVGLVAFIAAFTSWVRTPRAKNS